jgi:predicted dehydrogenase
MTSTMPPIRIGLVGPPKTASFTNGWAVRAHLPAIQASPNYKIVAVCNSTKASAQESIDTHNLGPKVKAYGSAEHLAQDPRVDLVVVATKLANHYPIAKHALLAGKDG